MPSLAWQWAICSASCAAPSAAPHGKKPNSLMIFKDSSLLWLAEHLPIISEVLTTSFSGFLLHSSYTNSLKTTEDTTIFF